MIKKTNKGDDMSHTHTHIYQRKLKQRPEAINNSLAVSVLKKINS